MKTCKCETCGNTFHAAHVDAMYCTHSCRNKARYTTKHKAKNREKNIRIYGITGEIYEQMLADQEYVCAICGEEESVINPKTGYPYPLSIDHSHETGAVRGLLCKHCNLVLGQVEKHPEIVTECLSYLEKTKELKLMKGIK